MARMLDILRVRAAKSDSTRAPTEHTIIGTRSCPASALRNLLALLNVPVCPFTVRNRAAFGDAGALGQTPRNMTPKGRHQRLR